jgi:hypothetical protein
MSIANNTISELGSTYSPATRGGRETTAAAGEPSVSATDTNLGQLHRMVPAARRGCTAPVSSVGHGARR